MTNSSPAVMLQCCLGSEIIMIIKNKDISRPGFFYKFSKSLQEERKLCHLTCRIASEEKLINP